MEFKIREMHNDEWRHWAAMRADLFEISFDDARQDCERFVAALQTDLKAVFVGIIKEKMIGFAEISERAYAEGCHDGPVAYLEGWAVSQHHRKKGVGRELVQASINWAKSQNYPHIASDVELENITSQKAHVACGFEEVDRVVQYRMALK